MEPPFTLGCASRSGHSEGGWGGRPWQSWTMASLDTESEPAVFRALNSQPGPGSRRGAFCPGQGGWKCVLRKEKMRRKIQCLFLSALKPREKTVGVVKAGGHGRRGQSRWNVPSSLSLSLSLPFISSAFLFPGVPKREEKSKSNRSTHTHTSSPPPVRISHLQRKLT